MPDHYEASPLARRTSLGDDNNTETTTSIHETPAALSRGAYQHDPAIANGWTVEQEYLLKRWAEEARCNAQMHHEQFFVWRKRSRAFAFPVIIFSTITGAANFAHRSFPDEWQNMFPLVIGGVNILTGIIGTLAKSYRVDELMEGHRAARIAHDKLASNIEDELCLPPANRNIKPAMLIAQCREIRDRLLESGPPIGMDVIGSFKQLFKRKGVAMPTVMAVRPIFVYRPPGYVPLSFTDEDAKHGGDDDASSAVMKLKKTTHNIISGLRNMRKYGAASATNSIPVVSAVHYRPPEPDARPLDVIVERLAATSPVPPVAAVDDNDDDDVGKQHRHQV